jgi:TPR repeat protein
VGDFEVAIRALLLEGHGIPQDSKAGMNLLENAAERGLVPAMFLTAQYAIKVKHVSQQNISLARKWFSRAADMRLAIDKSGWLSSLEISMIASS